MSPADDLRRVKQTICLKPTKQIILNKDKWNMKSCLFNKNTLMLNTMLDSLLCWCTVFDPTLLLLLLAYGLMSGESVKFQFNVRHRPALFYKFVAQFRKNTAMFNLSMTVIFCFECNHFGGEMSLAGMSEMF